MAQGFEESEHPRWPKGDPRGGQFAPKGAGAAQAVLSPEEGEKEQGRGKKIQRAVYRKRFQYQRDKMTLKERQALGRYRDGDGPDSLRLGEAAPRILSPGALAEQKEQVQHIDSAFEKVDPLEEDILVYRGTRRSFFDKVDIGDEVEDLGYVSTSVDMKVARGFAEPYVSRKVIAVDFFVGNLLFAWEYELLLRRGTRFRVVGKREEGGISILELDVVKKG